MRWEDERYVRVYTRDTAEWLALGWEAQSLLLLLLRKADRAGIIQTGKAGVRGVAALAGMPLDVVQEALPALLEDGCLRAMDGGGYVFPNFLAAQEARSSDAQRKREQRARDRDKALGPGSRAGLDAEAAAVRAAAPGAVYVVRVGGRVKVGFTATEMDERLRQYRSHAPEVVLLASGPGSQALERDLHRALGVKTRAGEWCDPTPDNLAAVIARVTTGVTGVTAHVTRAPDTVTDVTDSVTPSRAVPCRAEPCRAEPSLSASQGAAAAPPDDLPDASADAERIVDRPTLELVSPTGGKKPREPSKAERLYAGLQGSRAERCAEAGVGFADDGWKPARMNRDLGALARLPEGCREARLLNAAWAEYLADDTRAAMDVPWSLGYFLASRAQWEGRALKAAGGDL